MKIIPLGGANEVGASATLIELGHHRILVDAGIRIGAKDDEQLPDLTILQQAGPIAAITLPERISSGTHAFWAAASTLR